MCVLSLDPLASEQPSMTWPETIAEVRGGIGPSVCPGSWHTTQITSSQAISHRCLKIQYEDKPWTPRNDLWPSPPLHHQSPVRQPPLLVQQYQEEGVRWSGMTEHTRQSAQYSNQLLRRHSPCQPQLPERYPLGQGSDHLPLCAPKCETHTDPGKCSTAHGEARCTPASSWSS